MFRRAGRPLAALVLAGALVLSGCTHSTPKARDHAGLDTTGPFAEVTGEFGAQPRVDFPDGKAPAAKLQRRILRTGTGPALAVGDLVVADYLAQVWRGKVFDNSYTADQAATLQVGVHKLLPGLDAGLVGVPVGSRVELVLPPSDGYGSAGNKTAGIGARDTLVYVLDLAKRYNGKSSADPAGEQVGQPAGRPVVGGSLKTAPLITFPRRLKLPARRITRLVARGHGAPLVKGTAVIQYYSVDWHGKFVGSTWLSGTPTSVPVGDAADATAGVFDGLVGLPIGSRALIVAPAPPGPGQPDDTAVIAVDILDQVSTARRMVAAS